MEPFDPRSLAIARIHLQSALRNDGDRVALHWGSNEAHQANLTDSLDALGFDLNAGSDDFEVPPAQMPEAAELIVLTKAGQLKLETTLPQR